MIGAVVSAGLRFRLLVLGLAAAIVVFGAVRLSQAPVDVLPEHALPVVEIQTESLGLSAAEVEQFITVPLEQDLLNGIKGVDTIRSDSVAGLSAITLVFERGTDILRARQLVQERLSQPHAFPSVSKPPQMLQPVSAMNRVMMIGLSARRLSAIELSVLARWTVRPRLMGIAGVANVAIWGHRDRQLQVQVDPKRLRAHGVSLLKVIETTGNAQLVSPLTFLDASTPGTGGFIDGPNQRLSVRHVLPFGKPADLAAVPIEETRRRLGDVAHVVETHQPLIGDAIVDGGPGLMLVVEKLPGTNTLEVTRKLDAALAELRQGLPGVRIDSSVFRPAASIESAIDHLALALAIAALLALVALVAFLFRWRAVFIGAVAIPLSLLAAALALVLMGMTINALAVAGLAAALALVIDDAAGDVEHLAERLRARGEDGDGGEPSRARLVVAATLQQRSPLGYATLIVLLAAMPVLFLGGVTGAFVHPMVVAYGLAVVASTVVALTVTPALALLLLTRGPRPRRTSPVLPALADRYERGLLRFGRRPRPAVLALAALLVAGAAAFPLLGQALRPAFKDRALLVHWDATPSTSLPEMRRLTTRAVGELRGLPGVRDVGAHVGRAVTGDQVVGTGSSELWARIDERADYDATLASIRRVVAGYPGVRGRVLTYESERSAGVFASAGDGLTVRVYGQDLGVLRRKAQELRGVLAGVEGVRAPRVQAPGMQPTLEVEVDLVAAERHGLKPGDVRRAAATLISGLEVGSFFEQQKVFSVVVRGVPSTRHSVDSVRALLLDTPTGGHVRLGAIARVAIRPNPVDIRHDAVSRYIDVRAAVAGRDAGAVRHDVQRRMAAVRFPLEYHAELLDRPADDRPAQGFAALAVVAAVGIVLLLQAAFGSWRMAALVAVALPAALVGGVAVVLLDGGRLTLGAVGGLFAVFGLAVRNIVALVACVQRLEREGEPPGPGVVLLGARERLAPVAASATTTALAVLPLALLGDVAGNEITRPLALVVLGGLVTSTLLALFIAPALHWHYGRAPATSRARGRRRAPAVPEELGLPT